MYLQVGRINSRCNIQCRSVCGSAGEVASAGEGGSVCVRVEQVGCEGEKGRVWRSAGEEKKGGQKEGAIVPKEKERTVSVLCILECCIYYAHFSGSWKSGDGLL